MYTLRQSTTFLLADSAVIQMMKLIYLLDFLLLLNTKIIMKKCVIYVDIRAIHVVDHNYYSDLWCNSLKVLTGI